MTLLSIDCQTDDHETCEELGAQLFYPAAPCQDADCDCPCHRCPRCGGRVGEPEVRGLNRLSGYYDERCEDDFHEESQR